MIAERPAGGQQWSAASCARYGRFVADLAQDLDAKAGERILDLGCGDGALSAQIAARGATVLGVDASAERVAERLRRAGGQWVANYVRLHFTATKRSLHA